MKVPGFSFYSSQLLQFLPCQGLKEHLFDHCSG